MCPVVLSDGVKRGTITAAVALLAAVGLTRCGSDRVPDDVLTTCHGAIEQRLIEPDQARFWNESGRRVDDGWRVGGLVEALRHRAYTCHVSSDGEVTAHVS
jgi:hypothetical protein